MLNTVLSSRVRNTSSALELLRSHAITFTFYIRVSWVSAMVSVRFSGMFNMVQEFGTAAYRIAVLFVQLLNWAVLIVSYSKQNFAVLIDCACFHLCF